jgi:prepilin-type N-terminal cleavage/methylation domain-containing protein
MTRRTGVTLVEVLVAIFVMGIGLMALLTLFPIGMLRMAQAIRDSRSAEAGDTAYSILLMQDIRNDPLVITDGAVPDFFKNPYPTGGLPSADDFGESYPILVDPIGYRSVPNPDWVGNIPGSLRRRSVKFVNDPTPAVMNLNVLRSFSLWDDINFDSTVVPGAPQSVTGTQTVLRETRYSWAYVFRRPQTSNRSIVDCTVVVFDKRPLALNGNLNLGEWVYPQAGLNQLGGTYFNPTKNTITIFYTGGATPAPPIRPGDWIMDATLVTNNNANPATGSGHAYFYRVVAGEDLIVGGQTCARYEVQQPIRGFTTAPNATDPVTNAPNSAYQGTAIVIEGIADVYEKGPVRLP